MATERRPWPTWATDGYYSLRGYIHNADVKAAKALEVQYQNVYLTATLLSQLFSLGQKITDLAWETQLRKGGDDEQWPKWANAALDTAGRSGRYIAAGAEHALEGAGIRGNGRENWKAVVTGLTTCVEHIHKIEKALKAGPQPVPEFLPEHLADTLEMGEVTATEEAGRWRRRRRY